ncbi:MAG: hypothetical protein RR315_04105, partial [Oscillospiraceae bacterium]
IEVIISITLIGAIGAASLGMFNGYVSMEKKAEEYNQKTALFFSAVEEGNAHALDGVTLDVNGSAAINLGVAFGEKKEIAIDRILIKDKSNGGEVFYYACKTN